MTPSLEEVTGRVCGQWLQSQLKGKHKLRAAQYVWIKYNAQTF